MPNSSRAMCIEATKRQLLPLAGAPAVPAIGAAARSAAPTRMRNVCMGSGGDRTLELLAPMPGTPVGVAPGGCLLSPGPLALRCGWLARARPTTRSLAQPGNPPSVQQHSHGRYAGYI